MLALEHVDLGRLVYERLKVLILADIFPAVLKVL